MTNITEPVSSTGQLVPPVTHPPPNMTVHYDKGPSIEDALCSNIDYNYDPVMAVIYAMYVVFGIVYTVFGYRCFKASMFLTGFTFASVIVYLIAIEDHVMPPIGNFCVAICAGMLFGLITMLIQYVGLFITGFHTGLLLAIAGLAVYDHFLEMKPMTTWLSIFSLLGSGILFSTLNLYWKKAFTIFGTSLYGGAVIAVTIDYFVEKLIMVKWLWERAKLDPVVVPPCRLSWLTLAAWPAAFIVGLTAQCALTGTGVHHEESIGAQKRRMKAQQTRPMTREQRADIKQRKYRYLYQLRTAHGDVISQSYVQVLQKAQCANWSNATTGGECSTLQSDSTHLTVLGSADHAPHTDSDDELNHIARVR